MASAIPQAGSAVSDPKSVVSIALRYGLAVVAVAAALALTLGIRYGTGSPTFFSFYIAIFVSIWFAGRGPGWLALVLASLLLHYVFFASPDTALSRAELPTLAAFLLCAAAAGLLSAQRWRAHDALKAAGERLELTVQQRTSELKQTNEELLVEIAERKRAEASLRASEQWWRTIFEASNTPMGVTDLSGRHVVVNPASERLLGYTNDELKGISIQDLTHEDDRARTIPIFDELAQGQRQHYHVEKRYRCKDGSIKWLKASVTRVADPKGGPDLTASVVEDITERKRAEAAVRASEERWRRVFDSSAVAMALADGDRRIIAVNPACERLLGYTREEFLAMSAIDLKYGDDRDVSAHMLRELEQGLRREFQGELRFRRKDGMPIWVHVSVSYVPATEITPALFPAVIEDITQRKQAEAALRASEERWRTVFQTASVGIATSNADRRIASANAALQRMLGYGEAELQAMGWAELTHEDDQGLTDAWVANLSGGLEQACQVEKRYRRKDGKYIWVNVNASFVPATDATGAFFASIIVDITDRKCAEDALRQAQAELARVARVTTIGELGASIAHEINQPLAAIVASGNACRRWLENGQNLGRARESLDRVISDANRASDVVKRIRSLTARKGPEQLALDINAVVEDVLTMTASELQANNISIRRHLSPTVPSVMGDRVQLQQVVLNLVMNGIDAMAGIADRRRILSVSSQLDEQGSPRVTVQDSGSGLDPANAERIFEAFFTTKPDGMGMGLSISNSIIEAHGGRLWVQPTDPNGTAFHFTLPATVGRSTA